MGRLVIVRQYCTAHYDRCCASVAPRPSTTSGPRAHLPLTLPPRHRCRTVPRNPLYDDKGSPTASGRLRHYGTALRGPLGCETVGRWTDNGTAHNGWGTSPPRTCPSDAMPRITPPPSRADISFEPVSCDQRQQRSGPLACRTSRLATRLCRVTSWHTRMRGGGCWMDFGDGTRDAYGAPSPMRAGIVTV